MIQIYRQSILLPWRGNGSGRFHELGCPRRSSMVCPPWMSCECGMIRARWDQQQRLRKEWERQNLLDHPPVTDPEPYGPNWQMNPLDDEHDPADWWKHG